MRLQLKLMFVLIYMLCGMNAYAAQTHNHFYRAYWYPMYHGERLAYCSRDEATCGHEIATAYCHDMGYERVKEQRIAHNVGKTHFWAKEGECIGWKCDGFLLIGCEGKFKRIPPKTYVYRIKEFVFPRFENTRVDWCFNQGKSCGHRAAYSFCRRMGYSKVKSFTQDMNVSATKTLGDQALCYGKKCHGFENITCKR